jgi:cytochrome c-type biogenesis protein CcmF
MVDVGYFALCLALVAAGYAVFASIFGARRDQEKLVRSGENAAFAVFALLGIAVMGLWYAILTGDFSVQYVAENANRAMPTPYVIASLWGGQNGSVMFWGWMVSIYMAAVLLVNRSRYRDLMPYVTAVLSGYCFFFILLNLYAADPFRRLPFTPADGNGLNPILQHPYMAIHPPMLYAGMVGMAVPFAFALAALMSGHLDSNWLRAMRRWLLIPWTFLGAGLLLGGKWAYVELGWGGYWAWDPVENASLMPWLAATALLHSIMIQERKGMLKVWNIILVFFTYGMTVFGTFITRSGLIDSVHSFAQSSIGSYFVVYLVLLAVGPTALLLYRLPALRRDSRLESFASRETAFLLNNWILLGMLFAVLWGTLFPVLSEAVTGDKITVGAPFFNRINVPIGLVLLFLTGAGPLFAWRRTSFESLKRNFAAPFAGAAATAVCVIFLGVRDLYATISLSLCGFVSCSVALEFYRGVVSRRRSTGDSAVVALLRLLSKSRRRYGGYLVHVAMVLLFVGFTGKAFSTEKEFVLGYGEEQQIGRYSVTFESLAHHEDPHKAIMAAALSLRRDGDFLATLLPERRFYHRSEQNTTEVAIWSSRLEDFYLILVGTASDNSAKFQVYINPLVNCVWAGGILFLLGSLWTMWPSARERRLAELDRESTRGTGSATVFPEPAGTGG